MSGNTGHPKGLYLLFTVEMWERFAFYGMRALLVLFMVKFLAFNTQKAGQIYGWYIGLVYVTPLLGGYLADKYLGARKTIMWGAFLMAAGYFLLASQHLIMFYISLIIIIFGNGLFKPNISTIVGTLYDKHDSRKDAGFTIFYMGINLGAFMSPFICGTLGEKYGWKYGFMAAGLGMLIGLLTMWLGGKKYLGDHGTKPVGKVHLDANNGKKTLLTKEEKDKILVIFIMAFFTVFFWAAFEQAGASLTLFAERSTNRALMGFTVPTTWFQSLNPLFIILLAPIFSWIWMKLGQKGKEPSSPLKFAFGLLLLGLGFVAMIFAAKEAVAGKVNMFWLILTYLLHTTGELCLSPIGLSLVTKLSPVRLASSFMGVWFLAVALGNYAAGAVLSSNYDTMDHSVFFSIPAMMGIGSGLLLLVLVKPIKKLMHGVN